MQALPWNKRKEFLVLVFEFWPQGNGRLRVDPKCPRQDWRMVYRHRGSLQRHSEFRLLIFYSVPEC